MSDPDLIRQLQANCKKFRDEAIELRLEPAQLRARITELDASLKAVIELNERHCGMLSENVLRIAGLEAELTEARDAQAAAERSHDAAHEACVEYDKRITALEAERRVMVDDLAMTLDMKRYQQSRADALESDKTNLQERLEEAKGKIEELESEVAEGRWRCYHCGFVAATFEEAHEHFGPRQYSDPACTIDIAKFRAMEENHERHLAEDSDADRRYHALQADHQTALRREEEKGYSRGLADYTALEAELKEARLSSKAWEMQAKGYSRCLDTFERLLQDCCDQMAISAATGKLLEIDDLALASAVAFLAEINKPIEDETRTAPQQSMPDKGGER